jgi:NTP pyrophosphatase (non-canonical NTP hydrolase)
MTALRLTNMLNQLHDFQTAAHEKSIREKVHSYDDLHKPGKGFDRTTSSNSLRSALIHEEAVELTDEIDFGTEEAALKEVCDVLYVVLGAAVIFGWEDKLSAAFNRVHDNNMTKITKGKFNASGKLTKPDNYQKVQLGDLF